MALPAEGLTENSTSKEIMEAIWDSITQMTDEYRLDGSIDGEIFNDSEQAYAYARVKVYRIARDKTGRKLPDR